MKLISETIKTNFDISDSAINRGNFGAISDQENETKYKRLLSAIVEIKRTKKIYAICTYIMHLILAIALSKHLIFGPIFLM